MTVLIGVLGVVLGGLIGAVTTYVTTRSSMLLELEHSYDVALRDKRLQHYQALFHISKCIPRRWPPAAEPTREDLQQFRERFHDWYFGEDAGGMFLTPTAKKLYLELQNALAEAAQEAVRGTPLSAAQSQAVRHLASELRHQLAEDVGASQPPRLRWTRLGRTVDPPQDSAG
jgi:hypothetical protein